MGDNDVASDPALQMTPPPTRCLGDHLQPPLSYSVSINPYAILMLWYELILCPLASLSKDTWATSMRVSAVAHLVDGLLYTGEIMQI